VEQAFSIKRCTKDLERVYEEVARVNGRGNLPPITCGKDKANG